MHSQGEQIAEFSVFADNILLCQGVTGLHRRDVTSIVSGATRPGFALRFLQVVGLPKKLSLRTSSGEVVAEINVAPDEWLSRAVGRIEEISDSRIRGWILDADRPSECFGLLQLPDGRSPVVAHANERRPDLIEVFGDEGPYGFSVIVDRLLMRGGPAGQVQLIKPQTGSILDSQLIAFLSSQRSEQDDARHSSVWNTPLHLLRKFGHFNNVDLMKLRNPHFRLPSRIGDLKLNIPQRAWGEEALRAQLHWLERFRPGNNPLLGDSGDQSLNAALAQTLCHIAESTPGAFPLFDLEMNGVSKWESPLDGSVPSLNEVQLRVSERLRPNGGNDSSEKSVRQALSTIASWSRQVGDGSPVISPAQAAWLLEMDPRDTANVKLSRYALGRYETVEHWSTSFDLDLDLDRIALIVDLSVDELVNAESDFFLSGQILAQHFFDRNSNSFLELTELVRRVIFAGSELGPNGDVLSLNLHELEDKYQTWLASLALGHPLSIIKNEKDQQKPEGPIGHPFPAVSLVGLVGSKSGLGYVANTTSMALESLGITHEIESIDFSVMQPGRAFGEKDVALSEVVIFHAQPDALPGIIAYGRERLRSTKCIVGVQAWETTHLPDDLLPGVSLVDELWTISNYCAQVFSDVRSTPVRVLKLPVDVRHQSELNRESFGLAEDHFIVGFSFDAHSSINRKNPLGVLKTFDRAGDENWRLILKIRNFDFLQSLASTGHVQARGVLEFMRKDSRVILLTDELSRSDNLGFLNVLDAYVSLHRSEGFGYTMAEAMALGVPTLGTNYSGNLDFMNHQNSWLCKYDLRTVHRGEYPYWSARGRWAEPNLDDSTDMLRDMASGGRSVAERSERAMKDMQTMWSPTVCIDNLEKNFINLGINMPVKSTNEAIK